MPLSSSCGLLLGSGLRTVVALDFKCHERIELTLVAGRSFFSPSAASSSDDSESSGCFVGDDAAFSSPSSSSISDPDSSTSSSSSSDSSCLRRLAVRGRLPCQRQSPCQYILGETTYFAEPFVLAPVAFRLAVD